MNTAIHHISAHDKTAAAGARLLREGGFVFIRVLENRGAGNYTVSLGRSHFEAFSDQPLEPGSVFRVQVTAKNDQIRLVPEAAGTAGNVQELQNGMYRLSGAELASGAGAEQLPAPLQSLFSSLGLPADAVSLRLVSFLQQNGLKLDSARMVKSRRIASYFPGREAEAAETALLLAEKGMEPDIESVAAMLNAFFCRFDSDDAEKDGSAGLPGGSVSEIEDSLFDRLYGKKLSALDREQGILTLSNHLGADGLHWVVLPFEYDVNKIRVFGNIRILIDIKQKNTKKMLLEAEYSSKKYFFVLYYNGNAMSDIVFRIDPPPQPGEAHVYEKMLEDLFSGGDKIPDIAYDPDIGSGSLYGGEPDLVTRISTEA